MADYYVSAAGSNTAPYDTWAKAATLFGTGNAAATTAGDRILVDKDHQENNGANTTWTVVDGVDIHVLDKDAADAPAVMGTGGWIGGNDNFTYTLTGGGEHRVTGLTIRNGGASARPITLGTTDGSHWECSDIYFYHGNTSGTGTIILGGLDSEVFIHIDRPTFRFGATGQTIQLIAKTILDGGSISSAGSAPTTIITASGADQRKFAFEWEGGDLSHAGSANLVLDSNTSSSGLGIFRRCTLGASYVMLSTSVVNNSGLEVLVLDCASGDTHTAIGHQNALGSTVIDTGIYFSSDPLPLSWKIVSTANASPRSTYLSPWIDKYNSDVATSITPYIEILRDGSATAYQDDEVWGEWSIKETSGFPISSIASDRVAILGTPANQAAGAGTGSWTGENATAWSGKVQRPAAVTPAEVGHIRGRVVVGEPSITVYVSPLVGV